MMATLTMSGIRASGMNQAAGRYSYQCSIIALGVLYLTTNFFPPLMYIPLTGSLIRCPLRL